MKPTLANDFLTIDDFDFGDKTALVRVDINCPVDDKGSLMESERIPSHAATLKELSEKGARVVVLAHQGRPGDKDFLPLQQHAAFLSKRVGKKVEYIDTVYGPPALEKIQLMQPGDVLLLENVRYAEEEMKDGTPEELSKTPLVQQLSSVADVFVNDAFSAAHRAQASMVGFAYVLPSCAGRVMQREVENISRVAFKAEHPNVYVLGGAKPDDVYKLMKNNLDNGKVDKVLVSGVLGNLVLMARGVELGQKTSDYMTAKGFDKIFPKVQETVKRHGDKIVAPLDLAYEENGQRKEAPVTALPAGTSFKDIGWKTIELFKKEIGGAKSLYLKGPQGVFEESLFEAGSRETMRAIAANSKAFSLMGGCHTEVALQKFGIDKSKISYVSLAGGALLTMLAGEPMPALDALRHAAQKKGW